MRLLLVLVALCWATFADAQTTTKIPTVLPPVEFDKPYPGILLTQRLPSEADMRKVCPEPQNFPYMLGCAWKIKDGCLVIIVSDEVLKKYRASAEIIYRHEIGHC